MDATAPTKARIAVVGSGLIGASWAVVFARAGHEVVLYDTDPAQLPSALAGVGRSLKELASAQLLGEPPATIAARVTATTSFADALRGAGHVQENVAEDVDVKRSVYAEMDRLVPDTTILASSTSGIPTSAWSEGLVNRSRCLVAHPVNPPHLVPLVELSGAPWTSVESIERTRRLMLDVGQAPITVQKEIEGFILNRLQGALLREAFDLFAEGYASLADIDTAVRDGLSLRWSFMGPFETIDLNAPKGVADYCRRYGPLYARMIEGRQPAAWSRELVARIEYERRKEVPASALAERRAWRDARLTRLNVHRRAESRGDGGK